MVIIQDTPMTRYADRIQRRFEKFHADNPQVYAALEELTQDWVDAGHDHASIDMFYQVLRYRRGLQTTSADEFKLNDHYRSRYARLLMARHPEWDGLFETRSIGLKGDGG
jgi:hypothetical protein